MSYSFCPISSPGGVRNVIVDYTDALGLDELIRPDSIDVTCPYPGVAISGVAVNSRDITVSNRIVKLGKGIQFTLSTVDESDLTTSVRAEFTGEQGTADVVCISLPIKKCL